jgi:outer membrane protein assembly factor BamB
LWRFKRPIPEDILLPHPTSRGVGLFGDKVYFATADAVLVTLDAKTGNEVRKQTVEESTHRYYMSPAPLVAGGKETVGVSGGALGVRDFVAAFDAETGKPVWKTYTVMADKSVTVSQERIGQSARGRRYGTTQCGARTRDGSCRLSSHLTLWAIRFCAAPSR